MKNVYRHLFNYACLQAVANNNLHGTGAVLSQITTKKHPKSICSSVLSCYFEADNVKKYTRKHHACYR